MKTEKTKVTIIFLILAAIFCSSACSSAETIAQEKTGETPQVANTKPIAAATPIYKKPKRVSKDIILEDTKEIKQKSKKAK